MPGPMYVTSPHVRRKACNHFVKYAMPCDEYDNLLIRADCACEICGRRDWVGVDHDHALGPYAARGILCAKCNAHMRLVDCGYYEPSDAVASYLEGAWHLSGPAFDRVQAWRPEIHRYDSREAWQRRALAAEAELRRIKGEK